MAKRRARQQEEEFEPPPFDETAYMQREREGAKASVVTFALAVLLAVVSAQFTFLGAWPVGLLLLFVIPFALPKIYPLAKVDLELLDRKTWASLIAILVLTSISLWILFLNPPFVQSTPPVIKSLMVAAPGQQTQRLVESGRTVNMAGATNVTVTAYVPDSDPVSANFTIQHQNNNTRRVTTVPCNSDTAQCTLQLSGLVPTSSTVITLSARDSTGKETSPWTLTLVT